MNGSSNCNKTQGVAEDYDKFLCHCNAMDYADLINGVKECFKSDAGIKELYEGQHYLIYGTPTSIVEVKLSLFLHFWKWNCENVGKE